MAGTRTAPTPDWLDRDRFPYEQRHVQIGRHDLAYVDEGAGPPLLLLHGNPTWSFLFRDVIAGLRDRFRCIALDLPGFGFSTAAPTYRFTAAEHADVVEAFVEALDLRDVTLLVHDWGGPIGLGAAARHPERYVALVLLNTFAWPANGDLHFEAFSRFLGGPVGRQLILRLNAFVNVMVPAGTRMVGPDPAVMAAYRGPTPDATSRIPTAVFPREILAAKPFLEEVERGLEALRHLPTLLVWGEKDVAFRRQERERFEAVFADHRTVRLEDASHYVPEEDPGAVVAAVRAWSEDRATAPRPAPGAGRARQRSG